MSYADWLEACRESEALRVQLKERDARIAELEKRLEKFRSQTAESITAMENGCARITALQSANSALLEERDRYKKVLAKLRASAAVQMESAEARELSLFSELHTICEQALAPTAEKQGGKNE
jgi:chromosome segregation ATPase